MYEEEQSPYKALPCQFQCGNVHLNTKRENTLAGKWHVAGIFELNTWRSGGLFEEFHSVGRKN